MNAAFSLLQPARMFAPAENSPDPGVSRKLHLSPGQAGRILGEFPGYPHIKYQGYQHLIPKKFACCGAFSLPGDQRFVTVSLLARLNEPTQCRKGPSEAGAGESGAFGLNDPFARVSGPVGSQASFGALGSRSCSRAGASRFGSRIRVGGRAGLSGLTR